jgi:hypothetical protein
MPDFAGILAILQGLLPLFPVGGSFYGFLQSLINIVQLVMQFSFPA